MLDVAVLVTVALTAGEPRQDPPVFKSGVELVMVDAQVVDRKGAPVPGLTAQKFQVTIDGKRRTVVSAELIDANTGLPAGAAPTDTSGTAGAKALAAMPNVYILAVDQGSFRAVNAPSAVHAARELLKRAAPNDYVGMIGFPAPAS